MPDPTTGARAVPIYQTTSYVFKSTEHAANLFALKEFGNIYTRIMNPTTDVFEQRIAAIEGGTGALAVASGQAAITLALLTITQAGRRDRRRPTTSTAAPTSSSITRFPKLGRDGEVRGLAQARRRSARRSRRRRGPSTPRRSAIRSWTCRTSRRWRRSPTRPACRWWWTTPSASGLVRPIDYGADILASSATKYIGGHGTSIGGVIVDSGKFKWNNGKFPEFTEPDPSYHGLKSTGTRSATFPGMGNVAFILKVRVQLLRDIGAALSPFNAFLFLQGLETLPLRQRQHSENALAVARFLKKHPLVSWVTYPGLPDDPNHPLAAKYLKKGFGGIVGFGIKGGLEAGKKFINSVKLLSHLANIGDAKSLVIHPASTTHQQLTRGGAGGDRRDGGLHPALHRPGGRRGHQGGHRPGAQEGRDGPSLLMKGSICGVGALAVGGYRTYGSWRHVSHVASASAAWYRGAEV